MNTHNTNECEIDKCVLCAVETIRNSIPMFATRTLEALQNIEDALPKCGARKCTDCDLNNQTSGETH